MLDRDVWMFAAPHVLCVSLLFAMSVHVFFLLFFVPGAPTASSLPETWLQTGGCKKKNSASTLGTVKRAASLIFQVMEEFLQVHFCRSLVLTMDKCAHILPRPRCSERPSLRRGSLCASFVHSYSRVLRRSVVGL